MKEGLIFAGCMAIGLLSATGLKAKSWVEKNEVHCNSKAAWVKHLETYGERPVLAGKAGVEKRVVFELWINPQTGSWTTLYTLNADRACSASSGWDFKAVE